MDSRPLYARIVETLLDEIRRTHAPGDLLPTQQELAERFGASLITVKRALNEIGRMGLIESVRGKGTLVRRPTVVDVHTGATGWTDAMRGTGVKPETAWTRITREAGPTEIRRLLNLRRGGEMVVVTRLRMADGAPICLMTNALPAVLVPDLEVQGLQDESLYAVLQERYGLSPAYADEEVTGRTATGEECDTLQSTCEMMMHVQRISYDASDRPIELARLVAPSDRYTYRVRVHSELSATGGSSRTAHKKRKR